MVLLIGLAGGVVLTTAAAARRTDTAYARYLKRSHAADVLVSPTNRGLPDYYPALAKLPSVAEVAVAIGFQGFAPGAGGALAPSGALANGFVVIAPGDSRLGHTVERPKVIEGRMSRSDHPNEAVADSALAGALHLRPGSTLRFAVAPTAASGADFSKARPMTVTVVGIVVSRDNVVPVNALATTPTLLVSPGFAARFQDDYVAHSSYDGAYLRLKPGSS